MQRAYNLSQCGDTIGVEAGTYDDVEIDANGSNCSVQTTFVPLGGVVTIVATGRNNTALSLGNENKTAARKPPNHLTFDGGSGRNFHFGASGVMGLGGMFGRIQIYADYETPTYPSHITLRNLIVDHDAPDSAQGTIGIDAGQYVTIDNVQIGPICCGLYPDGSVAGSPTEIGVGNRSGYAVSDHVTIENSQLLGETYVGSTDWPSVLGQPPQADCGDTNACHADAVHIVGGTNFTITGNKMYDSRAQTLFFEPIQGSLGGTNLIANNYFDTFNKGACAICVNGGGAGVGGIWNIYFNTGGADDGMGPDGPSYSGATFNFVGNYGSSSNCPSYSGATVNYSYNVWTGGPCGATDKSGAFSVLDAGNWATNDDNTNFDLAAGSPAIGRVPVAVCTTYVTSDLHGAPRPNATHTASCDAGADETR